MTNVNNRQSVQNKEDYPKLLPCDLLLSKCNLIRFVVEIEDGEEITIN
jgi:hypothetical protein